MKSMPLALLLAATLAFPAAAQTAATKHWQTTWIASAQPVWGESFILPTGLPRTWKDATLRQPLRTSLGGERVRIVLSNEHARTALGVGHVTIKKEGSGAAIDVTFAETRDAVVAPGARLVSDPVALPVAAGDRLEVDVYVPGPAALAGFHWDARETTHVFRGNRAGRAAPEGAPARSARAFVAAVMVESGSLPRAVVALGDSITDGNGSTPGLDQRWPDHLARRLAPRGIAVLNAGISGNRLLRNGMGTSALARFDADVLSHRGVEAVVVLLGTNDIGWPGGPFAPKEAVARQQALERGFLQLAAKARAAGVRLVVATLPPLEDALRGTPFEGHYSPAKERQRQALNAWLRASRAFDAVVDFDAVLRDPARPARLEPAFDSGDHLHPSDAGYKAMADAIDLDALLGTAK